MTRIRKGWVGIALVASLATGATWSAMGSRASSAEARAAALEQALDDAARGIALARWHGYLEGIGWPAEMVARAHPTFLDVVSSREVHADGSRSYVFDGSRPGELRRVSLRVDELGREVGQTFVEWADVLVAE